MNFLHCHVEIGHPVVVFATSQCSMKLRKSSAADADNSEMPSKTSRKATKKSTAGTGRMKMTKTCSFLELEMRPLTEEVQQEAVEARLGASKACWFMQEFKAATELRSHPFGLSLLIGYAGF